MPTYKIYLLDAKEARSKATAITCDTEQAAMTEAYALSRENHAVEVWCGYRLVVRVSGQLLSDVTDAVPEL